MKIKQEFEVAAPKPQVWAFFHDVPSVVQCLPGAEITEANDHGSFQGQLSSKLGPIALKFEGKATVEFDEDASRVTIRGEGVDRRGGSRGNVAVTAQVTAGDGGTHVEIETDLKLSGAAARFGRTGLISDISERMMGDFAACVEAKLKAKPETAATIVAAAPQGLRVLLATLWARLRRLLGREGARRRPPTSAHRSSKADDPQSR